MKKLYFILFNYYISYSNFFNNIKILIKLFFINLNTKNYNKKDLNNIINLPNKKF